MERLAWLGEMFRKIEQAKELTKVTNEAEKKEPGTLGGIGGGLAKLLKVVEPEIRISPRLLERDSRTVLDLGLQLSVNLPGDLDSILVGAVLAARSQLSGK